MELVEMVFGIVILGIMYLTYTTFNKDDDDFGSGSMMHI